MFKYILYIIHLKYKHIYFYIMKTEREYLSETEIKNINQKYRCKSSVISDEIMKLRNDNVQKLQPFIKQVYNKKKKRHMNNNTDLNVIHDPYKFKQIPKDMKSIIIKLMKNNHIGLTTLAYKCNIPSHVVDRYLHNNMPIDNSVLHKILLFLNYDLDTGKFIDNSYKTNSKTINLENTAFKNMDIEPIDLKTLDIDKI